MGQDEVLCFLFWRRVIKNDDSYFSALDIGQWCKQSQLRGVKKSIEKLRKYHYLEFQTRIKGNNQQYYVYRLELARERQVEVMIDIARKRGDEVYDGQYFTRPKETNRAKFRKNPTGTPALEHFECIPSCD